MNGRRILRALREIVLVGSLRSLPTMVRLRGYGIAAWFAARASVFAEQRCDAFLQHRLAGYLLRCPPALLCFLPPLSVDAAGELASDAFDARVPSDFVLGDPAVEPPPRADHPLAAAIRQAAAERAARVADAMRQMAEIEDERQRGAADARMLRERLDAARDALQRCLAEIVRMTAGLPGLGRAWRALVGSGMLYLLVLFGETAWLTTSFADQAGVDMATVASVQRQALLFLSITCFAFLVTLGLVAVLRFVYETVVRFWTARTARDGTFAPVVLAAASLLPVLGILAFIGGLRAKYSAAAIGAEESFAVQVGFVALHVVVLIVASRATMQLDAAVRALATVQERREALRRRSAKHEAALALIRQTIEGIEERLDALRRMRARLNAEHWRSIDGVQSYLRGLLEEGEAIKVRRDAYLTALRGAISGDRQQFTLFAHRFGRADLLGHAHTALTTGRCA